MIDRNRHMSAMIAIGLNHQPEERVAESLTCGCGGSVDFEFNAIGQMVERCRSCRRTVTYQGGRMRTRNDVVAEHGFTFTGDFRRMARERPRR